MSQETAIPLDFKARLNPVLTRDTVFFNKEECAALGRSFHDEYVNAHPFPHAVLDDFLPREMLRRVILEFPQWRPGRFSDRTSNLKTGYQLEAIDSPFITNLMYAFNSAQFLAFLEALTGIEGLIPDPYYLGGGLHETLRGGHLGVHVDFNTHEPFGLLRRLNLILFLNENWQDSWGGHLELWDRTMEHRARSLAPVMGRTVVFNTDPGSFHGHPDPLAAPEGVSRRSIALYYYTAPRDGCLPAARTTNFQPRPGSSDPRSSLRVKVRYFVRDRLLPIIGRRIFK